MRSDIETIKNEGADGVVFGLLTAAGEVDAARTRDLLLLARPLSVTFHRAFDLTRDPFEALDSLAGLGADRVLTSGQATSALECL
jgi:copper homeostasis protein